MGTALKFVTVIKDDATFRSLVLDAPKTCLCIVDCYSEIWGPCEALSKKLQSISTELIECVSQLGICFPPFAHMIESPILCSCWFAFE